MTQVEIDALTVLPININDFQIAGNALKGLAACGVALLISIGALSILKIFRQG